MAGNFLHGVETIEVTSGTRPIRAVRTAVIGLVGTAPLTRVAVGDRTKDTPVLITSRAQAAKYFGPEVAGYSIPQALRAIFNYGTGIVVVVNTFDPATDLTAVAAANHVLDTNDQVVLGHPDVSLVVVQDSTGVTTYVANTDYTVDAITGVVTRTVGGAIAGGATIKIAYSYADPTKVLAADIVGTVDGDGDRSGMQALLDAAPTFGFSPKLLIAPRYSDQDTVADALQVLAESMKAMSFIDAPADTTVAEAIEGRATGINFARVSSRVGLCYPRLNVPDADGNAVLEPFSQHLAGAIAQRDDTLGYHWSPSNAELLGVSGLERTITFDPSDPTCDANLLNEAGIITAVNIAGVLRSWGNRSSAWPSVTTPDNFIAVRRVGDVLNESVRIAMLPYVDQPINDALIDAIRGSVNQFIRSLIGRGALVDGSCVYDPAANPAEELAQGHLVFGINYMPPTPAERITFNSYIDINLLRSIGAATT